ncbi:MAG: hypothetical protein IKD66_12035 [Solobacterium sp.]|nr:hypothetical protein [Solobacterium sp.]
MTEFFNSPAFFYVLLIGFAGYTVYYLYNVFVFLRGHFRARKQYQERYGMEGARVVRQYYAWGALYVVMIGYCIYSIVTLDPTMEQFQWFRMAFFFVGMILVGQLGIILVKRSAIIGPEAFVIEDAVIPFRSVVSMDPKKRGIQRIVELITTQGKYTLSREMGLELHDAHEAWKKERKEKKEKKNKGKK